MAARFKYTAPAASFALVRSVPTPAVRAEIRSLLDELDQALADAAALATPRDWRRYGLAPHVEAAREIATDLRSALGLGGAA